MKKKTIANLVMIGIILVVAVAGVLTVGHIQGWFDKATEESALLTEVRGIVNLERDGVSYPVETDTILRAGDKITCDTGATAVIRMGKSELALGQQAQMEIFTPEASSFSAEVKNGEIFVNTDGTVKLSFDQKEQTFSHTVACVSVRSGAQSISVFEGTVGDAEAGQMLSWAGEALEVRELTLESLSDFHIARIRLANQNKALCFTDKDLNKLEEARREAQRLEAERSMALEPEKKTEPTETEPTEPASETEPEHTEEPIASVPGYTQVSDTEPSNETELPKHTEAPKETEPPKQTEPPKETEPETEPPLTVTLAIYCDTILNNWDDLNPAKAPYVPSSGVILYTTVEITAGETVFDVLQRTCSAYGISLEYSWTPAYDSYYVEGINNLYQMDCGSESGWMYKVDGWFANCGCSAYTLSGGENIAWCYTCKGYGADLGGSW